MAALIKGAKDRGGNPGLNEEEMAFHDALAKPEGIRASCTDEEPAGPT